jgi:hypothetical protein
LTTVIGAAGGGAALLVAIVLIVIWKRRRAGFTYTYEEEVLEFPMETTGPVRFSLPSLATCGQILDIPTDLFSERGDEGA